MAQHRLPGMSISTEQWDALAECARDLGITRTELIRRAISRALDEASDPLTRDLIDVARDLIDAQRRLAAINALLVRAESTVAA
jgi:hypothetical protein